MRVPSFLQASAMADALRVCNCSSDSASWGGASVFLLQAHLDRLQALKSWLAAFLSTAWEGGLDEAGCRRLARTRLKVRI